ATADPKLTKALQAAASASASPNGPPPDGIFPEGAADKRHPRGTPTSVEVIAEGSEPRVSLSGGSGGDAPADRRPSIFGPAALELALQFGPRSALAVDFALSLGPAKKDDGGADWLVADMKRALPAERQLGQLPPSAEKQIASLAGTDLRLQMTPDGRESAVEVRAGKAMDPDLERFAASAAEALVLATVPFPPKPVGVGGQWIAETRMPLAGLDVIAYRAYRVKEIDGDRARLAVNVKAYAASTDVKLPGVPKGATLVQFDAQSQAEMEVVRGEPLARKADLQQRTVMVFQQGAGAASGASGADATGAPGEKPPNPAGGNQPGGNMMTAQLQSQATFVRGDDLRVTSK
ncbi:MAG: hypothetical protein JOZ69_00730, partial [Myxococcales bacterium]|nr:hypothetical protein [Myxococcales bacterium]